jgi:Ras-related protein Rab-1A
MALNQEYNYVFKILIVGNSCAGKTNILCRFADNIFHESFLPTIGVDFRIRSLEVDNKSIKLQIWDTAGQERFKTITATYYKGAHGCILVYDITDRQSFQDIENWLGEVKQHASPNIVKILVGTNGGLTQAINAI